MDEFRFLETIEIPESTIGDMRANFEQVPQVVRPNTPQYAAIDFSIAVRSLQEADFRIEIFADLRMTEAHRPVCIVIVGANIERIVATV